MMFLAIKEMKFAKARYFFMTTIVTLMVALVFLINGLAQGLSYDNASVIHNLKESYFVIDQDAEGKLLNSSLAEKDGAALQLLMASVVRDSDKSLNVVFMPKKTVKQGEMIASTTILRDMKRNETVTLKGGTIEWKLTKVTTAAQFSHAPVAYIHPADFKQVADWQRKSGVNAYMFKTKDAANEAVKQWSNGTVIEKSELFAGIPGYKEESLTLNLIVVVLLLIATLVQAVFFYIMTLQKTAQFGTLKAIGIKARTLAASIIWQVLFVSTLAIAISMAVALAAMEWKPETLPFYFVAADGFMFAAITLVISLIASLFSVWQVQKADALSALGGAQ